MATGGGINTDFLSDETFDSLCSICERKGKHCEAEKYCVECNDYYCLVCVKVHEDFAILSGHKVIDKGQFNSSKGLSASQHGSSKTLPIAPTERCHRHNKYYIDMYCQNHDDVGCAKCIAEYHRACKDTFYIPEFLQNNASTPTSVETAQSLERVSNILTKNHSILQHEQEKLVKAKADALENIRKFRKAINERLDKLEQNSINEIKSLYKALIEEIKKATKEIQTHRSNIKAAQNKLACPRNKISQVFVNAKKGNKTAKIASKWIDENEAQIPVEIIDFKTDQRISKFLEERNTLGRLIQRNTSDEGNMATSVINPQDKPISSSQIARQEKDQATSGTIQQNVLLQGCRKKTYTVKVKSDEFKCDIVSACALADETIILSDYNNMKLKRLDSSTYTVTDYCDLPGQPWQVCPISTQEVAVCLPGKQVVQFISIGSRMTKTGEINTDFKCFGIAYANGPLIISDSSTSVNIYSIAGSKLNHFILEQSGQRLFSFFSDIRSLAVSKDGSRIYISDLNKRLIVMENNGQVVGRFSGPQLETAHGCYLIDTGSLLVCGEDSHNVLQFGPDGELIGEVVKSDKGERYQAICCNQQMSKLTLGSNSNEIEVYDLEK